MAELGFRADIVPEPNPSLGLVTFTIQLHLEVWDGSSYGLSQPFMLDTGAEITTISASLARTLGLSAVGGRQIHLRGISGRTPAILLPFRFRFARWPDLEITGSSCAIVPGEKDHGLLAFRDIHPRLELFKIGEDLFLVPPLLVPPPVT
jgi:hypothetical protein